MASRYVCNQCCLLTRDKTKYYKHLQTKKHLKMTENCMHACTCGKKYIHRSGLYKHQLTCLTQIVTNEDTSSKELMNILKQQTTIMSEMVKNQGNITNNIITQNNTINNTNNFNINVFLNETCKDAISYNDFIYNIQISHEDMLQLQKNNLTDELGRIISRELKALDISRRPLHCIDGKRQRINLRLGGAWIDDDNIVDDNLKKGSCELQSKVIKKVKPTVEYITGIPCEQWNDNEEHTYHELTAFTFKENNDKKIKRIISSSTVIPKELYPGGKLKE